MVTTPNKLTHGYGALYLRPNLPTANFTYPQNVGRNCDIR